MKLLLVTLLLLCSCATTSSAPVWRRADWSDVGSTKESVRCAVAGEYDAELAGYVFDLPIFVRSGIKLEHFDAQFLGIYLDADNRSLLASPYRHEVFEHVVPFFLLGWPNTEHAEWWHAIAMKLDDRASQCRRGALH